MNNQYYIPHPEDLRMGYECEIQRKIPMGIMGAIQSKKQEYRKEWEPITIGFENCKTPIYPDEYGVTTVTIGKPYDVVGALEDLWSGHPKVHEALEYLRVGHLRTPYLTKEQLAEKLNWLIRFPTDNFVSVMIRHEEGMLEVTVRFKEDHIIQISTRQYTLKGSENTLFLGKCPSINEFRFIYKLLNIT